MPKQYTIKPLVWEPAGDDYERAQSLGMELSVFAWQPVRKWHVVVRTGPGIVGLQTTADSLDHAKELAEAHYRAELEKALEEVGSE